MKFIKNKQVTKFQGNVEDNISPKYLRAYDFKSGFSINFAAIRLLNLI